MSEGKKEYGLKMWAVGSLSSDPHLIDLTTLERNNRTPRAHRQEQLPPPSDEPPRTRRREEKASSKQSKKAAFLPPFYHSFITFSSLISTFVSFDIVTNLFHEMNSKDILFVI